MTGENCISWIRKRFVKQIIFAPISTEWSIFLCACFSFMSFPRIIRNTANQNWHHGSVRPLIAISEKADNSSGAHFRPIGISIAFLMKHRSRSYGFHSSSNSAKNFKRVKTSDPGTISETLPLCLLFSHVTFFTLSEPTWLCQCWFILYNTWYSWSNSFSHCHTKWVIAALLSLILYPFSPGL